MFVSQHKHIPDSFQAFLVKDATFTSKEEYPVIPSTMVSQTIPDRILPFEKAIVSKEDLRDTFICSYSPDQTFERIRRNPAKYISFFKRTAGLIGFDFSIHTDMPIVMQKAQMYDNLALTYYFGKNNIPIIPNIRCGVRQLLPEFLSAIPSKSMIAIGTHGFIKSSQSKYEWYIFLEQILTSLHPLTIVIYGSLKGAMFDDFKQKTQLVFYKPWMDSRYEEAADDHKRSK
ncbi:MAG: DUF4417 domain-containing protein [Dehalococcoidales bacterium]|nr:DUF4417 domain-containing protein [Dehalococcoidales bacterium]